MRIRRAMMRKRRGMRRRRRIILRRRRRWRGREGMRRTCRTPGGGGEQDGQIPLGPLWEGVKKNNL